MMDERDSVERATDEREEGRQRAISTFRNLALDRCRELDGQAMVYDDFAKSFVPWPAGYSADTVGRVFIAKRSTETCRIAIVNYQRIKESFDDHIGTGVLIRGDFMLIERAVPGNELETGRYRQNLGVSWTCRDRFLPVLLESKSEKEQREARIRQCEEARVQEELGRRAIDQRLLEANPSYSYEEIHRKICADSLSIDVIHRYEYGGVPILLRLYMNPASYDYQLSYCVPIPR